VELIALQVSCRRSRWFSSALSYGWVYESFLTFDASCSARVSTASPISTGLVSELSACAANASLTGFPFERGVNSLAKMLRGLGSVSRHSDVLRYPAAVIERNTSVGLNRLAVVFDNPVNRPGLHYSCWH
jgi:hypothetical protein